MTILSYLEQSVRQNLPLVPSLRAAQASETCATARRLQDVCKVLEAGASVYAALATQVPEMPRRIMRMTGAAERIGRLPQTLRTLMMQERTDRPSARARRRSHWFIRSCCWCSFRPC